MKHFWPIRWEGKFFESLPKKVSLLITAMRMKPTRRSEDSYKEAKPDSWQTPRAA